MSEKQSITDTFYGPEKVVTAKVLTDFTTPNGDEVVEVVFESGKQRIIAKKAYESFSTPTATDFTSLFEMKSNAIIEQFMHLVAENDITGSEAEPLLIQMSENWNKTFDKAGYMLWFGNVEKWTEGSRHADNISALDAHRVLKDHGINEESKTEDNS